VATCPVCRSDVKTHSVDGQCRIVGDLPYSASAEIEPVSQVAEQGISRDLKRAVAAYKNLIDPSGKLAGRRKRLFLLGTFLYIAALALPAIELQDGQVWFGLQCLMAAVLMPLALAAGYVWPLLFTLTNIPCLCYAVFWFRVPYHLLGGFLAFSIVVSIAATAGLAIMPPMPGWTHTTNIQSIRLGAIFWISSVWIANLLMWWSFAEQRSMTATS
jgi:hypothetical protein